MSATTPRPRAPKFWQRRSIQVRTAVLAAVVAAAPMTMGAPRPAAAGAVPSALGVGVTHTRFSADSWNDPTAVDQARSLLRSAPQLQNQHLMGWGTDNPEPSPGIFNWASLDSRLSLIRATGGTPVITLCCSPDWMKGGMAGVTDWTQIEVAPTVAHFDDFAELARQTALRYPDVKQYQVWNELKGFWDSSRNRWNIEAYTDLYNRIYTALKSVDPTIKVGGPYVPMDTWSNPATMSNPSTVSGPWGVVDQRALDAISYWLANKRGADFVAVDGWSVTKDAGLITDEFTALDKFAAITSWIRARTPLPVWWSEFYPVVGSTWSADRQNAVMAAALQKLTLAGASSALMWEPQTVGSTLQANLWTDTRVAGGGQQTRLWSSDAAMVTSFPPGTSVEEIVVRDPAVRTIASPTKLLVVNASPQARDVKIGTRKISLAPYGVVVTNR